MPPKATLAALALSFFLGCGSSNAISPDGGSHPAADVAFDAGSDATLDPTLDAESDGGSDAELDALGQPGDGMDGNPDATTIAPEDEQLCQRVSDIQAPVPCPDETSRLQRCEGLFARVLARGACLLEVRAALNCGIDAGSSAYFCNGARTGLMSGFCGAENDALLLCGL